MRAAQHTPTPGPWKWERFTRPHGAAGVELIGFRVMGTDPSLGRLQLFEAYPAPHLVAVHEPNARLAAAAPSLRNALQMCRDALNGASHPNAKRDALDVADAVLAMVTGSGETAPVVAAPPVTLEQCRAAITDLYWLWKWYRDEYPDAEPPAHLVKFTGRDDVAGRAFHCIYWGGETAPPVTAAPVSLAAGAWTLVEKPGDGFTLEGREGPTLTRRYVSESDMITALRWLDLDPDDRAANAPGDPYAESAR